MHKLTLLCSILFMTIGCTTNELPRKVVSTSTNPDVQADTMKRIGIQCKEKIWRVEDSSSYDPLWRAEYHHCLGDKYTQSNIPELQNQSRYLYENANSHLNKYKEQQLAKISTPSPTQLSTPPPATQQSKAERHFAEAKEWLRKGRLANAESLIDEGLMLEPMHKEGNALRRQVELAMAEAERVSAEHKECLEECKDTNAGCKSYAADREGRFECFRQHSRCLSSCNRLLPKYPRN